MGLLFVAALLEPGDLKDGYLALTSAQRVGAEPQGRAKLLDRRAHAGVEKTGVERAIEPTLPINQCGAVPGPG